MAAVAVDGAIGRNNKLLWSVKEDMSRLKEYTLGKVIVLGRKTIESLPKSFLADRTFVVVTNNANYTHNGIGEVHIAVGIDRAMTLAVELSNDTEAYILGGEQIYNQLIGVSDMVMLTWIDKTYEDADAFFPIGSLEGMSILSDSGWLVSSGGIGYKFVDYKN